MDQRSDTPDDVADYWAEIQESRTDVLIERNESNSELIAITEKHLNLNKMIRNVFAIGWVRGNVAGVTAIDKK